jgi:hypothetical protein
MSAFWSSKLSDSAFKGSETSSGMLMDLYRYLKSAYLTQDTNLRKVLDEEYKSCNKISYSTVQDVVSKLQTVEEQLGKIYSSFPVNKVDQRVLQVEEGNQSFLLTPRASKDKI